MTAILEDVLTDSSGTTLQSHTNTDTPHTPSGLTFANVGWDSADLIFDATGVGVRPSDGTHAFYRSNQTPDSAEQDGQVLIHCASASGNANVLLRLDTAGSDPDFYGFGYEDNLVVIWKKLTGGSVSSLAFASLAPTPGSPLWIKGTARTNGSQVDLELLTATDSSGTPGSYTSRVTFSDTAGDRITQVGTVGLWMRYNGTPSDSVGFRIDRLKADTTTVGGGGLSAGQRMLLGMV